MNTCGELKKGVRTFDLSFQIYLSKGSERVANGLGESENKSKDPWQVLRPPKRAGMAV